MADLSILMETRSTSALFKRAEQLKRWAESETNKESDVLKSKQRKINFTDGCVFLAACSAGDTEEVKRLINRGADIDTANVDGLTALHQACIDDNLDMVEFLVEHGADVNCGDNEGWTPLHATASCGFLSIARYLMENGADVAAVNNDGELSVDIAESEVMEALLQQEINRLGIDCELARNMEEQIMMEDANQMLNSKVMVEKRHPKSGATALHVASAKGYIKVMSVLIQAGIDLNAQDVDGWTPLHAAAHWGQREACKVLAENLCNMDVKNFAGQMAVDVADADLGLVDLLEELKKKQDVLRKEREKEQPEIQSYIQRTGSVPPLKKRTSVTRMSVTDKTNVIAKDKNRERVQIETGVLFDKEKESSVSSSESEETSEGESGLSENSEVEKKNIANKVESAKEVITTWEEVEASVPKELQKNPEPPVQPPVLAVKATDENEDVPSWRRAYRKPGNATEGSEDNEVVLRSNILPKAGENEQESRRENRRPVSAEPQRKEDGFRRERVRAVAEVPPTIVPVSNATMPTLTVTLPLVTAVATITTLTTATTVTTPSVPSVPSTPTTANSQMRRSYVPPVRDEESETQRKAHAKRVRETRRSTQGVTLEDLKSAEQLVQQKSQDVETQRNAVNADKTKDDMVSQGSDDRMASNLERRLSWRTRLEQEGRNKVADEAEFGQHTCENAFQTATTTTVTTSTSGSWNASSEATPVILRRNRPPSTNDAFIDVEPTTTVTVILPKRPSSRVLGDEVEDLSEDLKEQDKENENKVASQAAIQRRRRPKRRSTGVVYLDLDDGAADKADVDGNRVKGCVDNKDEDGQQQAKMYGPYSGSGTGTYGSGGLYGKHSTPLSSGTYSSPYSSGLGSSSVLGSTGTVYGSSLPQYSSSPTGSYSYSGPASAYSGKGASYSMPSYSDSMFLRSLPSTSSLSPSYSPFTSSTSGYDAPSHLNGMSHSGGSFASHKGMAAAAGYGSPLSTSLSAVNLSCGGRSPRAASPLPASSRSSAVEGYGSLAAVERPYRSSRYGSSSSLSEAGSRADTPSRLSERISRASSVGSTVSQQNETDEKDYKKLYEEEKVENDRLREKLKKSEQDLGEARQLLDKATQNNARNSSDAERREKRALERKLSELEEELKLLEQLKTENQRLRDENGALIRVISKLSK